MLVGNEGKKENQVKGQNKLPIKDNAELLREAIHNLAKLCGLAEPIAESETEAFLYRLSDAVSATEEEIEDSHADGLCLDAFSALAHNLLDGAECPALPTQNASPVN